ncbi:hypothetical protein [Streptacidiphilus sp. PAMC 29251]
MMFSLLSDSDAAAMHPTEFQDWLTDLEGDTSVTDADVYAVRALVHRTLVGTDA